ncbi:MAG: hypothetical protein WA432_05140 [Candidatus Babeliaceae bacterium]
MKKFLIGMGISGLITGAFAMEVELGKEVEQVRSLVKMNPGYVQFLTEKMQGALSQKENVIFPHPIMQAYAEEFKAKSECTLDSIAFQYVQENKDLPCLDLILATVGCGEENELLENHFVLKAAYYQHVAASLLNNKRILFKQGYLELTKDKIIYKEHTKEPIIFDIDSSFTVWCYPGSQFLDLGYIGQSVQQKNLFQQSIKQVRDLQGDNAYAAELAEKNMKEKEDVIIRLKENNSDQQATIERLGEELYQIQAKNDEELQKQDDAITTLQKKLQANLQALSSPEARMPQELQLPKKKKGKLSLADLNKKDYMLGVGSGALFVGAMALLAKIW